MQMVKHKNCVEFRGCYLREHTAWVRPVQPCLALLFNMLNTTHNNNTVYITNQFGTGLRAVMPCG